MTTNSLISRFWTYFRPCHRIRASRKLRPRGYMGTFLSLTKPISGLRGTPPLLSQSRLESNTDLTPPMVSARSAESLRRASDSPFPPPFPRRRESSPFVEGSSEGVTVSEKTEPSRECYIPRYSFLIRRTSSMLLSFTSVFS